MVTRADWAKSFLRWGSFPITDHNLWALVAWESAEGGYFDSQGVWHPGAIWNPLNTTQKMQGSWDYNWVHVQNYASEEDGLNATLKTIKASGHGYEKIVQGLKTDDLAVNTLKAVEASDWGTGGLAVRILHDVKRFWSSYSTKTIGQ